MSQNVPEGRVIALNIQHYRDLLARETDPAKRDAFAKLLATEEAAIPPVKKLALELPARKINSSPASRQNATGVNRNNRSRFFSRFSRVAI